MKCIRDECTSTTRKSTNRLSNFVRLQLCLFLCCAPTKTISAKSGLRRKTSQTLVDSFTGEPSYEEQSWMFDAIKLKSAWNMGFTGGNVNIRINSNDWGYFPDKWIEEDPMIEDNNSSQFDFSCGDPINDLEIDLPDVDDVNQTAHNGPAIASILTADGTDDFCGVGIAPLSKLSFCNFEEGITNPKVLIYDVESVESFDISINPFAYSGCSMKPEPPKTSDNQKLPLTEKDTDNQQTSPYTEDTGYQPTVPYREETNNQNDSSRLLESPEQILEACPFGNFYNDTNYISDDPCQVCTKEDFDFISGGENRDNVFENGSDTATKFESNSENADDASSETKTANVGVSEKCASSVRAYCLHNFRRDEELCTEWVDVINDGNTCSFKSNVGAEIHQSLETGVNEGRNGLGVIYIFSSGDSYGNGDNVNYQAFPKSRFVMTVGAVKMQNFTDDQTGAHLKPMHATYSTGGSSMFVVAPSGDYDSSHKHIGSMGTSNCFEAGYGTALAAPVVGGVVALMLEAYETATWRDVRAIIAETSKPVEILDIDDNNDDATFGINAAGYGYSELYGFGLIHARGAVQKAKNWNRKGKHAPPEIAITGRSGEVNLNIYDDSFSTTTSTIMLYSEQADESSSYVESVSVYVKLRYFNRGNLKVTLRSPSGTTSVLSPGGRNEYGQLEPGEWWEFLTLRSWGENPNGSWKLSITDNKPGNGDAKCIDHAGFLLPIIPGATSSPMSCENYESTGLCYNGTTVEFLPIKDYSYELFEKEHGVINMNAVSACCACGGGIKPDDDEYGQLIEWKIVLGDGSPEEEKQPVNFYDPNFGPNAKAIDGNETLFDDDDEIYVTEAPSLSPTEDQAPPTLPPTYKKIEIQNWEDTDLSTEGLQGVFNSVKNFFVRVFGGDEEDDSSTASSVVAWIITFGFSIMLLMRGSSLCDVHLNLSRESRNQRNGVQFSRRRR